MISTEMASRINAQSTALLGVAYTGQQFNTVDPDLVTAFATSGSTDVRATTSYVLPTGATSTRRRSASRATRGAATKSPT